MDELQRELANLACAVEAEEVGGEYAMWKPMGVSGGLV